MSIKLISTGELAERLSCNIEGNRSLILKGIATIDEAKPDQLTFLANPRYRKHLAECNAGAIIITSDIETPDNVTKIISKEPYIDFRRALEIIYPNIDQDIKDGINPAAEIHETASTDLRLF